MEFIINNSPTLTMAEITKLLFNRNFLSDVQFHVAEKTIYAHSLELMKRSIVFQKQLVNTLGENKLIPINDVSYDNVYQFVQYIYTDECTIDNSNAIGLLKLAKRYKVIKFENEIVRVLDGMTINLSLYEYCLLHNDELNERRSQNLVMYNLSECLLSDEFLTIHPFAVEEILKSNHVNASELEIFVGLARWIDQHSNDNQIDIDQQRNHYDRFLRLVRFPIIPVDELLPCTLKYAHLFNDNDLVSIFKNVAQHNNRDNKVFMYEKRTAYVSPYEWSNENIETIFTVSRDMVLIGLQFGDDYKNSSAELIIAEKHLNNNIINTLNINCGENSSYFSYLVNLGESIRLQPDKQYSINIRYHLSDNRNMKLAVRKQNVDIYVNVARNLIQFKQVSKNIFDMYFAQPE